MSNVHAPSSDDTLQREVEARVGRTLCGRYTLERLIGIGGMAAVYRGSHRNGNPVAIKVLHAELCASKEIRERFLREGYVANRVNHSGAVRVLDDDTSEDGIVFLVMELLEGETLENMIVRQGGTLSPSVLIPLVCQLLDVLAAAHAQGIVHRDIKPDNLFITHGHTLKVLDFGIARLADSSRQATRTGRVMGTPVYMAPEQARGEAKLVDGQTDIWASGAVLFRALSGRFVYEAETPEMVMVQAATQASRPLRTLVPTADADVSEIVDRALAWKKDDRWKTAEAMATALRSARVAPSAMAPVAAAPFMATQAATPAGLTAYVPPISGGFNPSPVAPTRAGATVAATASPPFTPVHIPNGPMHGMQRPSSGGWIKWVVAGACLIALCIAGGAFALISVIRAAAKSVAADASTGWSDDASPVPVSSKDPIWGARNAPVTIVSFSDFQCPFCSRVQPTLEQVKTAYGPEKVRIIWKNQPLAFHVKAKPAAEAAQVVFTLKGSDAFWQFHDTAFKNQAQLSPESYEEWAVAAGVDAKAFKDALATQEAAKKVDEDQNLASRIGVNGTPAFRVNGVELSGAQPFTKFKELIDAELKKAEAKIATGTAKDRIYVAMSTENFKKLVPANDDEDHPDETAVHRVLVGDSPVRGSADAPVTIVMFSDFQCPFCKRIEPTIEKISETYGGKVRIVWKHEPLPFHPRAEPAAELALEARAQQGDKGFWNAHDKLFASQPKLEDADLLKIAGELGLDLGRVRTAIRDKKYKAAIDADVELADDVQATGTPHCFINGRRLVGAQPFEKFEKVIDEELKKYDAQQGRVPARSYYASLMKDAKGASEPEKKQAPPVPASAPFRGGKGASVVIQQWSDFQCPFCARVEPTLTQILEAYGDRVKIVWRDKPLPMHSEAPLAAEAAREAMKQSGPDGFWRMHKKLFENQQHLKREDLHGYAKEVGLDAGRLDQALDSHAHKPLVDADDKVGTDLGISGTPAFLINSYYLSGAQPFPKFKKLIDRALAESR